MTTDADRAATLDVVLAKARNIVQRWRDIEVDVEDVADVEEFDTAVTELEAALELLDQQPEAPHDR